jgi:hypothetical protein
MSRISGKHLAQLVLSCGVSTLLMVPYLGISAIAQTSEETTEAETSTEAEADNEDASTDSEPAEPAEDTPTTTTPRFTCQMHNGQYTVMYSPESQPEQAYPWAIPGDMGSTWPAERRCNEISARLESYRPDGLSELQTGLENGYNIVCVTTEAVSNCRIVFTVPEGQNPIATRDQVFENLALADSGQQTQGVNTLVEGENDILGQIGDIFGPSAGSSALDSGSNGINLRPFLAPEDGGTGTQLRGNSTGGRALDPDNFR